MSSLITIVLQITILLTYYLNNILSLPFTTSVHCAVRREISPCTCQKGMFYPRHSTKITCERMSNFSQVLTALQNRFEPGDEVSLTISFSKLEDLPELSFKQLGLTMKTLYLNHDNLSILPEAVFTGLGNVEFLSLAENSFTSIPKHVLKQMPFIKTLDLGFGFIENVTNEDFQAVTRIRSLVLANNRLSRLESMSMPKTLHQLHLGHNRLTDLNGTLRSLTSLEWLFMNDNNLTSLDNQLPDISPNTNLMSLLLQNNRFQRLPQEIRNLQILDSLFVHDNEIRSLDGALAKSRKLKVVNLRNNNLEILKEDDFLEAEKLEELDMRQNCIESLNSSLLPLRSLTQLYLSHNKLKEFSLQDIRGLRQLLIVDLSHNQISKLGGRMENLVESETRVIELRLEHNELVSLSGSLMGLTGLKRLNLSHNRLETISPDDLIGLDTLQHLDISHNRLTTLEETSKTFLPSLEELRASHNLLTVLERDFHGLPVLCWADLSHNKIISISKELAEKTQCRVHGVNSTLRIYLQGNPVVCDEKITEKITAIESKNNTKIHGLAPCPPPETETEREPEPVLHLDIIQDNKLDYNLSGTLIEPQVIAAQAQPLISPQPQTT